MDTILILGSAPEAEEVAGWPRAGFDRIVAINNAWRIRPDWDDLIHPFDFPAERRPLPGPGQRLVTQEAFVPAQNAFGGFVYAGATMAFTAAYWALHEFRPRVIAMAGCNMHYPASGRTHFYGTGSADPLRPDITLQSLEAKSARLRILAARQGCAMVNLSRGPSRLTFARATPATARGAQVQPFDKCAATKAQALERALGYTTPDGRYWDTLERFDPAQLRRLDGLWMQAETGLMLRAG